MEYIVAADIGGSKTKICLYDKNGELMQTYQTMGVGLAVDSCEELPEFSAVLDEIGGKFDVHAVAVNLGGKNQKQIEDAFKKSFSNAAVKVCRESEGTASLEFGRLYGAQVVLLAGTGTIAVAEDGCGNYVISGGWGANIGDDGSGYASGLEAVRQSLAALDNTLPLTALQKEITGADNPLCAMKSAAKYRDARDGVRAKLAPLDRKHIASYTSVVARHCENGEADALAILSRSGSDMGKLIVNTVKKLPKANITGVAVSGGLVNNLTFWQKEFEQEISKETEIKDFHYVSDGVMLGTFEIAKKLYKEKKGE